MPEKNSFYQIVPCGLNSEVCQNVGSQERCVLFSLSHLGQCSDSNINYLANLKFLMRKEIKIHVYPLFDNNTCDYISIKWPVILFDIWRIQFWSHADFLCSLGQISHLHWFWLWCHHSSMWYYVFIEINFIIHNGESINVAVFSYLWRYYKVERIEKNIFKDFFDKHIFNIK